MPTSPNNRGKIGGSPSEKGRLLADGGETFCVACGEAFASSRDTCPACGHSIGGTVTSDSATETTDDATTKTPAETDSDHTPEPTTQEHTEQSPSSPNTASTNAETTESPASKSPDQQHDSPATSASTRSETAGPGEEYCPECGGIVDQQADQCPHCGHERASGGKRPILAGVLSLIIIGSGQIYNGDIARGAGFFVAALILYAGGLPFLGLRILPVAGSSSILLLGLWAWAGYDAYTGAKATNTA